MSTKTYRVTHTPLLHSGQRFMPGDLIELADEHAQRGLKGGVIEPWAYTEDPMSGTGPALVMSGTEPLPEPLPEQVAEPGEPLPELPESAYPADAQSIPTEPEPEAAPVTKPRKGAKA
ncbi:MAG: hypothetical protein ACOZAP_04585 [Pseudomonadota bacterium]